MCVCVCVCVYWAGQGRPFLLARLGVLRRPQRSSGRGLLTHLRQRDWVRCFLRCLPCLLARFDSALLPSCCFSVDCCQAKLIRPLCTCGWWAQGRGRDQVLAVGQPHPQRSQYCPDACYLHRPCVGLAQWYGNQGLVGCALAE